MKLNFSISELLHSDTAIKNNILNQPDNKSLDNLLKLIFHCLQPIRDKIGKPINISSGYRNYRLNKLVKGSPTSGHMYGRCADFTVQGMSIEEAYQLIKKSGIKYTQLIQELGRWIHIDYDENNLKCENLRYNGNKYIKD